MPRDAAFVGQYQSVMAEFDAYMALKKERKDPSIGYFCMEYGLDPSLCIYSGGLGILAGDYLKETSDMNVNLVAVGLLYRYGYFTTGSFCTGRSGSQDMMRRTSSRFLQSLLWIRTETGLLPVLDSLAVRLLHVLESGCRKDRSLSDGY